MFAYRSILCELPRPAVVRESRWAPWLAVSVICFGAFMGQLDASIVTITFPAMERASGVPVAAVQSVSLSYLLGLIALLAPAGRLGDAVVHPGYSGAEQARPAFTMLAVVAAAAIALVGRGQARGPEADE
jgi:MFS family permease